MNIVTVKKIGLGKRLNRLCILFSRFPPFNAIMTTIFPHISLSILTFFLSSQSLYVPYLGTQLDHTDIEILENGVPHCAPQNGNTLLHAFADVARQQTAATGEELGYILTSFPGLPHFLFFSLHQERIRTGD